MRVADEAWEDAEVLRSHQAIQLVHLHPAAACLEHQQQVILPHRPGYHPYSNDSQAWRRRRFNPVERSDRVAARDLGSSLFIGSDVD